MKVKELISVMVDDVIIYKKTGEVFKDIYKGSTNGIPSNVLDMKVNIIAAAKKRMIDIEVL